MRGHGLGRRLVAGLGGVGILVGCVSASPPSPSALPVPSATTLPTPIQYGEALLVQGTDGCVSVSSSVSSPDPDGVTHVESELECTMRYNDPRVSGTKTGTISIDGWSSSALVEWEDDRRIQGAAGDWVGGFRGIYTLETGDLIMAWFEGVGSNAGTSFFQFIAAPPGTVTMGHRSFGLIFPGPPPPDQPALAELPTPPMLPPGLPPGGTPMPSPQTWGPVTLVQGTEACTALDAASRPTPGVGGEVSTENLVSACTGVFNDRRVTGTKVVVLNDNGWGGGRESGASVQWGAARVESAAGTWEGTFSGAYTAETGDMVSAWLEGTGAYAGFSLFEWIAAPSGTVTTGYPVIGLIFPGPPPPR